MADDEAILKKKLESTEDLEERREIRKQIRELRNKKFDEEIKKISSGEPSPSLMTNGSSKKILPQVAATEDDDGDPYGLLKYTTEEDLQALLNATDFTETDKRRKIRTRMREVREAKFDAPKEIKTNERNSKSSSKSEPIKESSDNFIKQQNSRTIIREPSPPPVIEPSLPPKKEPVYIQESSPTPERGPSPELIREPSPEPECELNNEPELEFSPEQDQELPEELSNEPTEESNVEIKNNFKFEVDHASESDEALSYCNKENNDSEDEENYDGNSDEEISGSEGFSEGGFQKNKYSTSSTGSNDGKRPVASIIDDVLAVPEPGIRTGRDFKKKLKKGAGKSPVNLEKNSAGSGEQVDFRTSLKKKSSAPVVNLERKLQGGEQVDFRTALQRKVEVPAPEKKEPVGGEQVDFRTALKQKVPKPVFDKTPSSPQQVDFRTALSNKIQTKTNVDKLQSGEQKDFRVVLKAEPNPAQLMNKVKPIVTKGEQKDFRTVLKKADVSPATTRKAYQNSEDSDDDQLSDTQARDYHEQNQSPDIVNDEVEIKETNEQQFEQERDLELEPVEIKPAQKSQVFTDQQDAPPKPVNKPPPPAPKKKVFKGKVEEPTESFSDKPELTINTKVEEPLDDVDGKARNRHNAKDIKVPPPKPTDKPRRVIRNEDSDAQIKETVTVEIKKEAEKPKEEVVEKPEENPRRRRRIVEESTEKDDQQDKLMPEEKPVPQEKPVSQVATSNSSTNEDSLPSSHAAVAPKKVTAQSKTMGRIKFGSDDEQDKPKEAEAKPVVADNVETVKFNGNINDDEGIKTGRRSRKGKEEETIEVSADLLAEINRPKEEPKKVIAPVVKTPQTTKVLTGKAAEREAERQKEREQREAERAKREAERAKERDEAARKRKEQKDAFEKKMEEKKRERALAEQKKNASVRAGRNAFKDKLEANAPPPDPNAAKVTSNTNVTKLLAWAQKQTMGYQGVNIENFSESWADGLAFAALLHSFCPEDIPIEELSKDTRRRNFELAFSIAKEEGVMDLLDVEDMVRMRSPDPKSIITYLHSVYSVFCN